MSYASLAVAAVAGWLLYASRTHPRYIMVAVALAVLVVWLRRRSADADDLPGRLADVAILAGVAHSGWCNGFYAYWAAIAAVIVGRERIPWRMALLAAGALATMALVLSRRPFWFGGFAVLDWTHFLIVAGSLVVLIGRSVSPRPASGRVGG